MRLINYRRKILEAMAVIESRSNGQVKALQKLRQKKNRDQENLILIEGKKLLAEALKSESHFKSIYLSEKFDDQELMVELKKLKPQVSLFYVSEFVFAAISTMKNPEGVIALITKPLVRAGHYQKILFLEDLQDPANLGTIIRTADAAGFDAIISSPKTVDFYNEKVLRGSMGSIFHIDLIDSPNLIESITKFKKAAVTIIGTALEGENLYDYSFVKESLGIIMGNESRGMSDQAKTLCDHLIKVPILGAAESLNVATAAAIVLYEIVRQGLKTK